MENIIDNQNAAGMGLSSNSIELLNQTRKWTMFLSILGFIFIGFIIIAGFSMQALTSNMGNEMPGMTSGMPGAFTVVYIIIGLLYFYPVYSLFMFSKTSKEAVTNMNQTALEESFKHQRNMYRFMGILTIIILVFYVLVVLFAVGNMI